MRKSHSIKLVLMTLLLASCTQQDDESWDDDAAPRDSTQQVHHNYYGPPGLFYYPFIAHSFYRGPYMYSEAEYYTHGYGFSSNIERGGFGSSHASARG